MVIEGYASAMSIRQGERLAFHLSGDSDGFSVEIRRKGLTETVLIKDSSAGRILRETTPSDAYRTGCGWPVRYQLDIPAKWPSGVYSAIFRGGNAETEVLFVVCPAIPGSASSTLYQLATNTYHAYNAWGGKSLYDFNSTGKKRSNLISFDRPLTPFSQFFYAYEYDFLKWLETVGIAVEYCTSIDLHSNTTLLDNYQLMISVGHDEYWTAEMRDHVETFVRNGGNAAFFGGNTCWWQVRLQPAPNTSTPNREMLCYKYRVGDEGPTDDPTPNLGLATTLWFDPRYANRPENRMTGLSFRSGADWANELRPAIDFIVRESESWVFAGTGLTNGSSFGADDLIVGYETDGVDFVDSVPPRVTGKDGTAYNFTILATADVTAWRPPNSKPHWAVMGLFCNNGIVFNAGTTDWSHGLKNVVSGAQPNTVATITENVVRRLSQFRNDFQKATLAVYSYHAVQADGDGWRFYFSTDPFVTDGWTYDGAAFYAHCRAVLNTVPVYRYHAVQANGDGWRFYYSTDSSVQSGWAFDDVAFYAYQSEMNGLVPVYQYHAVQANGDGWRFSFSTDAGVSSGWTLDGIAFYALPARP